MAELPWIAEAKKVLGVKEIPGPTSNKTILDWAKDFGGWVAQFYRNDDIPWCALFVGHCVKVAGFNAPKDMLAAYSWTKFGTKLLTPAYGCVVVYRWASGRHHVGFIVAQDATHYHTLGGNQANAVNVTRFPKRSAISFRFPPCDLKQTEVPFA